MEDVNSNLVSAGCHCALYSNTAARLGPIKDIMAACPSGCFSKAFLTGSKFRSILILTIIVVIVITLILQ